MSPATALKPMVTMTDEEFDAQYPKWVRNLSGDFWTPVTVARRAAELLVTDATTRVLDIGSGPGKFCIIGALATVGTFVGVEQKPRLVDVATELAAQCGAQRAQFIAQDIKQVDWHEFDAFYMFNPFSEFWSMADATDEPPFEPCARNPYVELTVDRLVEMPMGTRVATYHGFGGMMPWCYEQRVNEQIGSDRLELWVKATPS